MALSFSIPDSFLDLEREGDEDFENPSDDNKLRARDVVQVDSLSPSELGELLRVATYELADKEVFVIQNQVVFDQIYSLVKYFSCLDTFAKSSVADNLRSNLTVLLPNIAALAAGKTPPHTCEGASPQEIINSHRNSLKIYIFFLLTIVYKEEAQPAPAPRSTVPKGKGYRKKHLPVPWDWEVHRSKIICTLANALESDLKHLYGQSDPEESLLAFVAKCMFTMLENPALVREKETKDALCRIVAACSTKYHYTAQTSASIVHLIHKYEHIPQHIADAVALAETKYGDGRLAISLIREIGKMNPKDYARDTTGAENVGRFLVELADRLPKLVSTNVGILMPHFGGESYKMRSALVGVFGKLIVKAFRDTDSNSANGINRLRSKQAMLNILIERCRDVSAYTRSRVLQTWAELCEQNAVSMGLWNRVAEIAAGRLEDKAAMVRKSALHLLSTLLLYNPFGPQLRVTSFEVTLEKYKKKLEGMVLQNKNSSDPAVVAVKTEDPECEEDDVSFVDDLNEIDSNGENLPVNEYVLDAEKDEVLEVCVDGDHSHNDNQVDDSGPSQAPPNEVVNDDNTPDIGTLEQTRALVASLEAGVKYAKCLASTMPILIQLLASPISTDVEQGIQFLMRCRQFHVDGAEACLRKMFPLVFSQEKAIYEAVENAFVSIYIEKHPMKTAANLTNITVDASIGDLTALEHIISSLVSRGDISSGVISALWDFFTFNVNGITAKQCRGALSVLCMAAKSSPKVLSSHLVNIIDIGFGRWAKEEPLLARTACTALQRISTEDRETLLTSNNRLFLVLQSLIIGSMIPESSWYSAAEQAINTIYVLHPMPETFFANLIKRFHFVVFGKKEVDEGDGPDVEHGETVTPVPQLTSVQTMKLSRYFFVVSHVALKHLVYIESCVRKVRKQKADKERATAESQASKLDDGVHTTESSVETSEEHNINAELGVSASEDARLDSLAEKTEKEIISGCDHQKFIIGICAPVIAKISRNFNLLEKFPGLYKSAMLALCKLMVIDADFCDANLKLLFTVAQNATSEIVRSNCVIALGDLAVRFPNLLEPWTEYMYARLHDKSLSVRKNAVLVLSHLILNDMMKVKGYISELALCLEDEDARISNLVKLFFHELSKKGSNPVYNLLPDILSRLSTQNLSEEKFCNIMQFLIASIKKDKQMEGLIEKLCHRFTGLTEKKQWIYLAYCLSLLTFTEKGYKKLADLFKSYEHALGEDAVINYFRSITNKAKKFAKPELRTIIEDFEEKLTKCHEEKKEQERTLQNALSHQQKLNAGMQAENSNQDEEFSTITESEHEKRQLEKESDKGQPENEAENNDPENESVNNLLVKQSENEHLENESQNNNSENIFEKTGMEKESQNRESTEKSNDNPEATSGDQSETETIDTCESRATAVKKPVAGLKSSVKRQRKKRNVEIVDPHADSIEELKTSTITQTGAEVDEEEGQEDVHSDNKEATSDNDRMQGSRSVRASTRRKKMPSIDTSEEGTGVVVNEKPKRAPKTPRPPPKTPRLTTKTPGKPTKTPRQVPSKTLVTRSNCDNETEQIPPQTRSTRKRV